MAPPQSVTALFDQMVSALLEKTPEGGGGSFGEAQPSTLEKERLAAILIPRLRNVSNMGPPANLATPNALL